RLTLTFQSETGATILDPRPLAEKYVEIRGENIWERVIDEERRCHVTAGSHTASLKVEAPTIGWRYSLCYRPGTPGQVLAPRLQKLGRSVLQKCREVHQSRDTLAYALTQAVADSLAVGLDLIDDASSAQEWDRCVLDGEGTWVGFIWDSN